MFDFINFAKMTEYLGRASAATMLAVILVTGATGYWQWGSVYNDAVKERDSWKQLALQGTVLAERSRPQPLSTGRPMSAPAPASVATIESVRARQLRLQGAL